MKMRLWKYSHTLPLFPAILTFIVLCAQKSHCWKFETTENCAQFLEPGPAGSRSKLLIQHGNTIMDLHDIYTNETYKSWATILPTVEINAGCSISICSAPYLQGNCQQVNHTNQNQTTQLSETRIGSAFCNCKTKCETTKCPEIKLRGPKECARSFVESGCNICGGIYLDMNIGNISTVGLFPEKSFGIQSLVVKSACKFYTYDEPDFEGAVQIFQEGSHENLTAKIIESYRCECDTTSFESKPMPVVLPRNPNYPPFISISHTVENLTAQFAKDQFKNHSGLLSSIKSLQNKRSPRNAYIMILGMTGAGKSASINSLFGNQSIAQIGEVESVTSEIHEYTFPVPLDELGINNSELHVIDTPGLGDTRGLTNDAKFLATLETYMANHAELSTRIPNVVLVLARFTENRFSGDGANFVKMLRRLDLLSNKLFDKKFSNVIIVLTHYMSESGKIQKNPKARLDEFRKAIEEYSLFPKPIVVTVAENQPEDNELPKINGYYRLPTGESYPRNVLEKMIQATQLGGDPIGEAIVKSGFRQPENLKMSKNITHLLNETDQKVQHYLHILTAANFKIEETEVSTILANVYNNSTLFAAELRSKYPDTLPYLQLVLNVRNIFKLENVPKTSAGIIRLLKDIRKTPATMALLEKALGIIAPAFKGPLLIGSSYNVLADTILSTSPFRMPSVNESVLTEFGYLIPHGVSCKTAKSSQTINNLFASTAAYRKSRLADLGVVSSEVNVNRMSGNIKPGNKILGFIQNKIQVVREVRILRLELTDGIELSNEFVETLKSLPNFTIHNQVSVDRWKAFFSVFGTHVIASAYAGGSLEINWNRKGESNETKTFVQDNLSTMAQLSQDFDEGGINSVNLNSLNYSVFVHGGESNFHQTELKNSEFFERSVKIETWKESFNVQPMTIETSIKLVPISKIAKRVSPELEVQVSRAMIVLLNSTTGLVYTVDPEILRKAEELRQAEERRREEELKRKLEEKRLELERVKKEMDAERIRQQKAFEDLQKKLAVEKAKKLEAEARELRRIAEERQKELQRLAELQRIAAAKVEADRKRVEAAKAEEQRLANERAAREIAAQKERQLAREKALQIQIQAERLCAMVSCNSRRSVVKIGAPGCIYGCADPSTQQTCVCVS